jgi:hypothetical protein
MPDAPTPSLAAVEARLEAHLAMLAPQTARFYRALWRGFRAGQVTMPDRPVLEQAQRWLGTLRPCKQVVARCVLQAAYGRTAYDWRALTLKPYRRNEARLLASILRPEARAHVRAVAQGCPKYRHSQPAESERALLDASAGRGGAALLGRPGSVATRRVRPSRQGR